MVNWFPHSPPITPVASLPNGSWSMAPAPATCRPMICSPDPRIYGLSGTLFGKGWEENVQHAMNIIKGQCDW